jgi:hypothetical protein
VTATSPEPSFPTPAILLQGKHRWSKGSDLGRRVVGVIALAGGVAGVSYEALNGWPWEVTFWGVVHLPMALAYGLIALVGLGALLGPDKRAPWYQMWSLVELFEQDGLRLVVGRLAADQPGLVVRRGETLEVHAELVHQARGGLERHYAFRLVAPAGVLELRTPVHIERLTMEPLEARARAWGITVTAHGDATAIARTSAAAV